VPPNPQDPIDAPTWRRISELFDTARDLDAAARTAWLAELERSEPPVAGWLHRLLAAHADAATADWLDRGPALTLPAGDGPAAGSLAEGARVGPWRLLRPLGQGGMAAVWLAERADGAYTRQVALKLPLVWRLDGSTGGRFARERDIVAALEHPHIARLYDAGTGEGGVPWLAIEHVPGQPIDAYADAARLPLRGRIELMLQVLGAVQHAHTQLVIHRDLKPSNVLVDEHAQVKLLDFGIAQLIEADAHEASPGELTRAGAQALTPAYAAPEQAAGRPLSTATDVYAAGVLLHKLLTGVLPKDATCASVAAAAAGVAHAQVLRGDLDAILTQALRPEPAQRYASAAAFADDLRRWLQREPVLARREGAGYRLRRFVQRNRLAVGAGVAVALSLVLGLAAALVQAERAARERDRALDARFRSEAVAFFLNDLLVEAARDDKPITVPALLARGETMARASLADQPANLGQVLSIIGTHRAEVDTPAAGRPLIQEALALVRDDELRRDIECEDASWQGRLGEIEPAMATLARIGRDPAVRAITRSTCLGYLADFQQDRGELIEALATTEQALAQWQASRERWAQYEVALRTRLGSRLMALSRGDEAEAQFSQSLARIEQIGQTRGMAGIGLRNQRGFLAFMAGDAALAAELYGRNLQIFAEDKKDGPPPAVFIFNAGAAELERGANEAARTLLTRAASVADANGDAVVRWRARCLGAAAAVRAGDRREAAALMAAAQALPLPKAAPQVRQAHVQCAFAGAELALAEGRADAAQRTLAGLDAPQAGTPLQPHVRATLDLLRSRAALAAGDAAAARAWAEQALAQAKALQGARAASVRTEAAAQALAAALAAPR
jgi:serine/threonine-protein kinase